MESAKDRAWEEQITRQVTTEPRNVGIGFMALIAALALGWTWLVSINLATFAQFWHN